MCLYLYIHSKYIQYTHILCKQTFILNAINRDTFFDSTGALLLLLVVIISI